MSDQASSTKPNPTVQEWPDWLTGFQSATLVFWQAPYANWKQLSELSLFLFAVVTFTNVIFQDAAIQNPFTIVIIVSLLAGLGFYFFSPTGAIDVPLTSPLWLQKSMSFLRLAIIHAIFSVSVFSVFAAFYQLDLENVSAATADWCRIPLYCTSLPAVALLVYSARQRTVGFFVVKQLFVLLCIIFSMMSLSRLLLILFVDNACYHGWPSEDNLAELINKWSELLIGL